MQPDRGLAGPLAFRIFLLQKLGRFAQMLRLVGRLVGRYSGPVTGLRRRPAGRIDLAGGAEVLFRFLVLKFLKGQFGQAQFQLRQKILGGQVPFDPVPFHAVGIHHQDGRRPLGVEALESLGLFFDMDFNRDKIIGNKLAYPVVGIYLGIQPGAPSSHRGGAEIQQNRFLGLFCLCQGGIGIL